MNTSFLAVMVTFPLKLLNTVKHCTKYVHVINILMILMII